MKKRNLGIICACLALCGMAVAGTYAWLTAQAGPITNYFTSTDSQKINIALSETNFKPELAAKYVPGDTLDKNPTITNTSAEEAVYGAIKVTYQKVENSQTNTVSKATFDTFATIDGLSNQWTLIKTLDDGSELYMFNNPIAAKAIVLPELFQSVTIKNTVVEENGALPSYNIKIEGFATQAKHTTPAEVKASLISLATPASTPAAK